MEPPSVRNEREAPAESIRGDIKRLALLTPGKGDLPC